MEGWTCIATESQSFQAELIKNTLVGSGIQAVVLNQRDSSYGFGELKVMVRTEDLDRARDLLGLPSNPLDAQ